MWLVERPYAFTVPVADAFRLLERLSRQILGAKLRGAVYIGEVMARLIRGQQMDEIMCQLIAKDADRFTTNRGEPEPGDIWSDPDMVGRWDSEAHRARGQRTTPGRLIG